MAEASTVRHVIHEVGRRARQADAADRDELAPPTSPDASPPGDPRVAAMVAALELQLEDLHAEVRALREECADLRSAMGQPPRSSG